MPLHLNTFSNRATESGDGTRAGTAIIQLKIGQRLTGANNKKCISNNRYIKLKIYEFGKDNRVPNYFAAAKTTT